VLRFLLLALISLLTATAHGDDTIDAKIADTTIKIPLPAGMADLPKDAETTKELADLTPQDKALLRACVQADLLDPTKPQDPAANQTHAYVFAFKDHPEDIYSGDFIEFVEKVSDKAAHGMLQSENSSFDFEETKNRLDSFQKDSGIAMQPDGAFYSLGMVSRSGGCVSFMTAQYITVSEGGKSHREKCLSVQAYLLLNKKLVLTLTTIMGPTVFSDEILPLKHAAEKFQIALQQLNDE
jgi:hypothetical protein